MDDQDDAAYARAPEPADLARLCRALNDAGARYVLIGGFAVIAHGAARFTRDIDLLVDDAGENIARVKQGLSVLADNAAAAVGLDDVRQHVVVRVADQVQRNIEGVSIPVASPASLIRTKDTYRPQDAIDRAFLERLLAPDPYPTRRRMKHFR